MRAGTPDDMSRSRVFAKATALFEGDREAASQWMATSLPALGGSTPNDVLKTDSGVRDVENLIGRIEHGVYS
jgi:putative toxin-antitoxin system antitoxin component (TIGR02293 family)